MKKNSGVLKSTRDTQNAPNVTFIVEQTKKQKFCVHVNVKYNSFQLSEVVYSLVDQKLINICNVNK